ncbi:carboxypeptidase-like regulatory domain-containing protein [Nitrospira sp. T9]|uniref:carboxypeptidase-like regulatory domain-containing protein n=1 Tax=unclassified Nitrospira TaxID=2652172 RepID=UPI003F9B2B30
MKFISYVLTFGLNIVLIAPAFSYEEITVSNGGTITGKVTLAGKEPPALAYSLITNPDTDFCGRISTGTGWRLVDEFQVAPDGGLQNTVVFLEGISQGKPFPRTGAAKVTVEDCLFTPWVSVVQNEQQLHIVNMDPIIHDVQIYETAPFGSKVMLHRPLRLNPFHPKNRIKDHQHNPGEAMLDTVEFSKGRRILYLECGFHTYMQSWGVAVDNPYYAITDAEGNFTLPDVPEGVYSLLAWHPGMGGFIKMEVVILADETLKTRMEFQNPIDRRMAHNTMFSNYRFGTEVLEKEGAVYDVQATHETQDILSDQHGQTANTHSTH